jgi:carboxylesterase
MSQEVAAMSSRSSDIGVLLVHGFTGSPASLRPWAEHLIQNNFSIEMPLLPGHGTSWQELNRTTWHQWYAAAQISYLKLTKDCKQIFIAGLSMGGVLALRLAQHQSQTNGLILVNPSIFVKNKLLHLAPLLGNVIKSVPAVGNDIAKPGVNEFAYNKTPVVAAASMLDLNGDVQKGMHLVTSPTLIFSSNQDHVVSNKNPNWILNHISTPPVHKEVIYLENSFHVATLDHDADLIFKHSVNFINSKKNLR